MRPCRHRAIGQGQESLLKLIYGTYKPGSGEILVHHEGAWIDLAQAEPRQVLDVRRRTIGYVTQFLRVIPRVPALDIVAEPLLERGVAPDRGSGAGGPAAPSSTSPSDSGPCRP